jgi:tripartite-type tricarboxylate transporter receptor subunit TctC
MADVRARFEATGAILCSGSAEEMRQVLATDVAKWARLVKERGIRLTL